MTVTDDTQAEGTGGSGGAWVGIAVAPGAERSARGKVSGCIGGYKIGKDTSYDIQGICGEMGEEI